MSTSYPRRVRTWEEFSNLWYGLQDPDTGQPQAVRTDLVDAERRANARMAHLTGICPKCGDAGWWIDDQGRHLCDCPEGLKQAEAALREAGK